MCRGGAVCHPCTQQFMQSGRRILIAPCTRNVHLQTCTWLDAAPARSTCQSECMSVSFAISIQGLYMFPQVEIHADV
jgi:hypothetical protein